MYGPKSKQYSEITQFFLLEVRGTGKSSLLKTKFSTQIALYLDLLDPGENAWRLHRRMITSALWQLIAFNYSEIIVSSMSAWELLDLARKKKLKLTPNPEKFVRDALSAYPFKNASVTEEITILSETLEFKHGDPVDRIIASTAFAYGANLATEDKELKKISWLKCV